MGDEGRESRYSMSRDIQECENENEGEGREVASKGESERQRWENKSTGIPSIPRQLRYDTRRTTVSERVHLNRSYVGARDRV
jgi:hypothetical protein